MSLLSRLWGRAPATEEPHAAAVKSSAWVEDWPWSGSPPESWLLGGMGLSTRQAVGVPALLGVLLRIGNGVAMVPQIVYAEGERGERAINTWQYELLHRRPSSESTPGNFRGDLALAVAAGGNAFARKYKARGRVVELIALDSRKVKVRRSGGRKVFDDTTEGTSVTRDGSDIVHVRGIAIDGQLEGIAPITAARLAVTAALKRMVFEGRYFDNDARPGIALKFPESLDIQKAREWLDEWNADHQGLEHAGKAAALGGGASIETIPVSLVDAQFVEATRMTAVQCAGIYGMPIVYAGVSASAPTEADRLQFSTHCLGPVYVAIDQAFAADRDLFPEGSGLYPEHLADALLRPDTKNRYEAYKAARQAGWLTANEIRGLENYPPVEGGDEIQATPVGGAPNDPRPDEPKESREVIVIPVSVVAGESDGEKAATLTAVDRIGEAIADGLKALAERPPAEVPVPAPIHLHATLDVPARTVVMRRSDGVETTFTEEEG